MSAKRNDEEILKLFTSGAIAELSTDELTRVATLASRGARTSYVPQDMDEFVASIKDDPAHKDLLDAIRTVVKRVKKLVPDSAIFELRVDGRGHGICKMTTMYRKGEDGKTVKIANYDTHKGRETVKIG